MLKKGERKGKGRRRRRRWVEECVRKTIKMLKKNEGRKFDLVQIKLMRKEKSSSFQV